jgi:hypothetical protein
MTAIAGLRVLFVAGFGPIIKSGPDSRAFYLDTLGLPLVPLPGADASYLHAETINGVRHFALWPLVDAARSCFGGPDWPASIPQPQSWLEFDVEDIAAASAHLKARGCRLLVDNREEPWGQTVTRLLSPEGILIGITFTPWLRSPA